MRADPDVVIAEIAADRHGVLRTDHLRGAGLNGSAVKRRVAAGRLHRKYRNVFALGHPGLSQEGEWMAAVDACHPNSFLDLFAGACLWDLLRWEEDWIIDVTIVGASGRRRKPGIRIHHSLTIQPGNFTHRKGIPVATVPRLIAGLERAASPKLHRRVLREAEMKGFKRALPAGYIPTRSEFEHGMLRFCEEHGLPQPRTKVTIGSYEADFLFGDEDDGLFVETDAWFTHRGSVAFESDHDRDLWMKAEGLEFVRITWVQMTRRPQDTAALLRRILERLGIGDDSAQ